jgi:hypothetical protein
MTRSRIAKPMATEPSTPLPSAHHSSRIKYQVSRIQNSFLGHPEFCATLIPMVLLLKFLLAASSGFVLLAL